MIFKDINIILILFFILLPRLCRNIYIEKEAKLCGRLTGAVLRDRLERCLLSDPYIFSNSRLLDEKTTVRKDLFGSIRTAIFEDTSQPGVLIVIEKGSGNPKQVTYQFFSGIFQDLTNFMGSGRVWKYTYDVHNVHIKWLLDKLENLMRNGTYQRIIFSGHSLGAGVSILDAFTCVKTKICHSGNTKVMTFGGPRTGDEIFALNYNKLIPETYRVVVEGDIIPSFPPCTKGFFSNECHKPVFEENNKSWFHFVGYYHVGTEIYYPHGYENKYKYCKPRYEDPDCSPRVFPSIFKLVFYKDELNDRHNRYFRIEKNGNPCRFI
ncbi:Lipase, class 3 family-containing protein [Strongyloides ratti]|uniref:Lipase, class 3 family-containing protein n=1 Tax=Strongyloides ratti TaxID=34506 RepID=A0A090L0N0_STRRB|nr:Lipase, class 3 family-containing protein [Strongyloides ratti]CEF61054.1 Lipase, class 3 family-containing protein [Strongyloides ratti]